MKKILVAIMVAIMTVFAIMPTEADAAVYYGTYEVHDYDLGINDPMGNDIWIRDFKDGSGHGYSVMIFGGFMITTEGNLFRVG